MANHPSALKRKRQNDKRRARNQHVKSTIKTNVRQVREAVTAKEKDAAKSKLLAAVSSIDRAVNQGVLHHRTASRRVSRLTKLVNSL